MMGVVVVLSGRVVGAFRGVKGAFQVWDRESPG